MFSFNRILVPTDFGDVSQATLTAACDLAERNSGEIILLHVVAPAAVLPPLERMPVPVIDFDNSDQLSRQLEQVPESTTERAFVTDRQVLKGDPATVITEFAEEHDIDSIVMGTHSRSGIKHLLLGSVTEAVVRKAKCPVLTMPASVAAYTSADC